MKKLKPCSCGEKDLNVWWEISHGSRIEQLTNIEKIECPNCGNIVYGADDDSIEDWNNHRYDN